ncbi:MAG: glycoside hydrolase family 36 protein [Kiritimatiellia bacterium]|jgi:alpha-galactosidase
MSKKEIETDHVNVPASAADAAAAPPSAEIVGAGVVEQGDDRADDVVALDGALSILCPQSAGWRFELERMPETDQDILEYRLALTCATAAEPPAFTVEVRSPKTDMPHYWTPVFGCNGRLPLPGWATWFAVQRSLPLVHRFNGANRNRLTLATSEIRNDLVINDRIDEYDFNVIDRLHFFSGVKNACSTYEVFFRFDRRDVFWSDAVTAAADWISARSGVGKPLPAPASAYQPLYSTWYGHHHDISAEKIERELKHAAALGMETVILDAGWQWDVEAPGFSVSGDWHVSAVRFPDMAAHVRNVQAMGLKYMMWYAVPFVGFGMKAYQRFKDKILYRDERLQTACLDPRFPEVREHLAATLEKALKDLGVDGFKIDFIDQVETRDRIDPAVAENFAGRDVRTVPEGVERLMTEIVRRLTAVKEDILVEFRSAYFGPVLRTTGNMMRVADCPGQWAANRVGTINLRLVCPGSCVHADMIGWPKEASVEEAARYVLSSLFGTVQHSVVLGDLDARKTDMLRHWIAFSKRHLNALQKGALRAYHPEYDFPVVEGSDAVESIVLVSAPGFAADVPAERKVFVLNNTGTGSVLLRSSAARQALVRDVCGEAVGTVMLAPGLSDVAVPPSGYLEIDAPIRKQF